MAFRWRGDDGPFLVLFGSSFLLSKKSEPPLAKLSVSAHVISILNQQMLWYKTLQQEQLDLKMEFRKPGIHHYLYKTNEDENELGEGIRGY